MASTTYRAICTVLAATRSTGVPLSESRLPRDQRQAIRAINTKVMQAPNLLDFVEIAWKRPQRSILWLIRVIAAKLIVVIHLHPCLRQEGLEGFQIFMTETWAAVKQEHFHRAAA